MKKKNYIKPSMRVVKLRGRHQILAGSGDYRMSVYDEDTDAEEAM